MRGSYQVGFCSEKIEKLEESIDKSSNAINDPTFLLFILISILLFTINLPQLSRSILVLHNNHSSLINGIQFFHIFSFPQKYPLILCQLIFTINDILFKILILVHILWYIFIISNYIGSIRFTHTDTLHLRSLIFLTKT